MKAGSVFWWIVGILMILGGELAAQIDDAYATGGVGLQIAGVIIICSTILYGKIDDVKKRLDKLIEREGEI